MKEFETLKFELIKEVAVLSLNRPEKANALNSTLWFELGEAFNALDEEDSVRVIILQAEGSNFSAGIDFEFVAELFGGLSSFPEGKKQEALRRKIVKMQDCFTAAERCRKPIIASITGACVGAGVDLIAACDMRFASSDSRFCVKEIDLGIVADIGSLQRLPYLVGEGNLRELAFTGRTIDAEEAHQMGLVNKVLFDNEALVDHVSTVAARISKKSPLTIRGIKEVLNYSRDHSVDDGLNFVATWNSAMLLSEDAQEAVMATMEKRDPKFLD